MEQCCKSPVFNLVVILTGDTPVSYPFQAGESGYTTLGERSLLNAWVIAPSLFRVQTATSAMDGTLQPFARFHQDATWRSSITRSLQLCWLSQWTKASKQYTNWHGCARFEWALSKAGEQSTDARQWPVPPAGLSYIWMDLYSGWTKSSPKWDHRPFAVQACHRRLVSAQGRQLPNFMGLAVADNL